MTQSSLNASEYFTTAFVSFTDAKVDNLIDIPFDDPKFGILSLNAVKAKPANKQFEFVFTVDCSASMSDLCADKRSKMQHITHTLHNIMWYFNDNLNITVFVTIFAFDNEIHNILSRTIINPENIANIILDINKIRPRNSTDIELALKNTMEYITELKEDEENEGEKEREFVHIFMTDGDATCGEDNPTKLFELVDNNFTNNFIGIGIQHNQKLLEEISKHHNSAYYFIDNIESSGLVYGEILHNSIYKLAQNVEIIIEKALIYDFKQNIWTNKLVVGNIVGESTKIYHIVSESPSDSTIYIKYDDFQFDHPGDPDISYAVLIGYKIDENADLNKYIYRQRTLQLLYEVKHFNHNIMKTDLHLDTESLNKINEHKDLKHNLLLKMVRFIEEIRKYCSDNNLIKDKFMKNLSDDIYVCYKTFGTGYQKMYSSARQLSQGNQRQYTVKVPDTNSFHTDTNQSDTCIPTLVRDITKSDLFPNKLTLEMPISNVDDDMFEDIPYIRRYSGKKNPDNDNVFEIPELNYQISGFEDTPYMTPVALKIMRSISGNNGDKIYL